MSGDGIALLAELEEIDNLDKDGPDHSARYHFKRQLKGEVKANPSDQERTRGHRYQQKLNNPHDCIEYCFGRIGQISISAIHRILLSVFHHGILLVKPTDISFVNFCSGEIKNSDLGGAYRCLNGEWRSGDVRNETRVIAHEPGYYKRVREVWRDRERAQADPRVLGILVLLVGLLFTGAISIGVMFP